MDRHGLLWMFARSLGSRGRWGRRAVIASLVGAAALLPAGAWNVMARLGSVSDAEAATVTALDILIRRAERVNRLLHELEDYHEREIAPIERVLLQYRYDPALVRRIARALVVEGRREGIEPRLLLAVLLVENPWLDPEARSPVGARGLMQVMPMHRGKWPPCAPDLIDVESNICHGARIFNHYYTLEKGDVERALLRYNGCVRGTNTPDCHLYPSHVYARAGRASILAWVRPDPNRPPLRPRRTHW